MIEFLLADFNTGFAISIGLVLTLAILEGVGMLIGLSLMNMLDQISPFNFETDIDLDANTSGLTPLLGWLCLNRLPLLVWFVLFFSIFGIAGYTINYASIATLEFLLPEFIVYISALLSAVMLTRLIGAPLARLLPKNESSAVSNNSFVGLIAKITIGTAKHNSPAEAALIDSFNQKHYVLVCPESEEDNFQQGEEIVLVEKTGNIWLAVKFANL